MSTGASPVATAPPRAAASCAAAARARVSAAPSNIAIVMADNRPPVLSNPSELSSATLTYPMLSFALNALYACGHGYDVWYLRMSSERCNHATQGTRDASYCKLPAIASVLRSGAYSHVAFIDSDSFFLHRNVSIHELLVQYAPVEPQRAHSAHFGEPSAWFASDLPQLGDRPNGGFHVWRSSLTPPPPAPPPLVPRVDAGLHLPPPPTHTPSPPPPRLTLANFPATAQVLFFLPHPSHSQSPPFRFVKARPSLRAPLAKLVASARWSVQHGARL